MNAPPFLLRCLIALVLWQVPLCASAQAPNPPSGWEFVRDLDSLRVDEFHAVGDTIFMYGYDYRVAVKRIFRLVSFDGGKSWDSVNVPHPSINPTRLYFQGFFTNEAKIWFSTVVDDSRTFFISKDGKNYETVTIGKDTTRDMWQMEKFFIDPHDPNHWLHIGTYQLSTSKSSLLTQSFDGGRNWQGVQLPPVPNRPIEKLSLELVFDVRRPNTWYLKVIGQVHFPPTDDTAIVYRTTNNGDSYTPVNQWGTHYGVGGPGEVRRWWGPRPQVYYGPLIGYDDDDSLKAFNWLEMFHPTLPLFEPDIGFVRGLNTDNYIVSYSNPSVEFMVEIANERDTTTDTIKYIKSWIHQTTSNWTRWSTIWETEPYEYVNQVFLDDKRPTLWGITKFLIDTTENGYIPDRFKSYLYKYSLNFATVQAKNKFSGEMLKAYPTPSDGPIKVFLPSTHGRVVSLELCSAEGKVFFHTTNVFSISQDLLEWSVPEYLASGLYFLKIRTDDSIYLTKLILQR